MKNCKGCLRTLSIESFSPSKNTKDGLEGKCRDCRQKARVKYKRVCEICGKEFRTAKKETRLCSQVCVGALRTANHVVKKKCFTCGIGIEVTKYALRDNNYCSRECYWQAVPNHTSGLKTHREVVFCDNCGEKLRRTSSRMRRIKNNYCDMHCFSEGIGKHRRDPNLSDEERTLARNYPEYKKWRKIVLDLYGNDCVACFANGDDVEIHIHHIKNFSSHKELRTEPSNGVPLCRECHTDFHRVYGSSLNNRNQLEEFINLKSSFC